MCYIERVSQRAGSEVALPPFDHLAGVQLWNTASLIQHQDGGDNGPLVAAREHFFPTLLYFALDHFILRRPQVRLAGFRLMEAGLEKKPGIQSMCQSNSFLSESGPLKAQPQV